MTEQSKTTGYRDVMREQMHRQYAAELREAGWIVVHESDFTVESFHTDPYFRAVVERVVRWYQNPVPPSDEELHQAIRLLDSPLLTSADDLTEEETE